MTRRTLRGAREASRKLLLLSTSTLAAVALGEIGARVWSDEVDVQRMLDAGGLFVPFEPGIVADLVADEFRVRYRINAIGMRDPAGRTTEPIPGRHRVLLLGDSFAAGWGVEQEETFAARIEAATSIEVVNAASNGGCPLWFVHQARLLAPRFRPGAILVQVFDNDPVDNATFAPIFATAIGERTGPLPPGLGPTRGLRAGLRHEVRRCVLFQRARRLLHILRHEPTSRSPYLEAGARPELVPRTRQQVMDEGKVHLDPKAPLPEACRFRIDPDASAWSETLAFQRTLVDQLLDEAAAARMPVAVVYIPVYQMFLRRFPAEALAAGNPHRALLVEACRAHGAPFLDATDVLGGVPDPERYYHLIDGHLNGDGHAVLARELAPVVADLVRRP